MARCHCLSVWLCNAASFLVFVAIVQAGAVTIQNPFNVPLLPKEFIAGTSSLVSWVPTVEGTVSLKLFVGASTDMQYISTIAHFIHNTGSFAWTPSIALEAGGDYALLIVSGVDDQFIDCSPPFTIKRPIINRNTPQSSLFSSFRPAPTPTPQHTTLTAAASTAFAAASTASAVATSAFAAASTASAAAPTNSLPPTTVATNTLPIIASTTPSSVSGQATSSPTNPATSTQTVTQASSSSGLSTGAAIGIGIGVTLLALLVVGLLIFFLLRRRRQKRQEAPVHVPNPPGPAELEIGKAPDQKTSDLGAAGAAHGGAWETREKSELGGGISKPARAELSSPPLLSPEEYDELERRRRAVELQGQSTGSFRPAELQGQGHPRAELEALRANSRYAHELAGQPILSDVEHTYHR